MKIIKKAIICSAVWNNIELDPSTLFCLQNLVVKNFR
jgi:hypothetical protein